MIRSLFLVGLMAFATIAFTQTAEARVTNTKEFKFSGTLPQIVNTKLSLSVLSKKEQKKIALSNTSRSSCQSSNCDVVIVHPDGVPIGIRILGFALNFIPFAVGSWVVGDALGAYLGTGLQGAGLAMVIVGWLLALARDPIAATLYVLGTIMMTAGYITPLITVWFFRNQRYRRRRFRRRYYRRRRIRRRRRRYYRRRYYRRDEGSVTSSVGRVFSNTPNLTGGFAF